MLFATSYLLVSYFSYSSTMKMEEVTSSETSVDFRILYILEDLFK
jgi:hypothetical protein